MRGKLLSGESFFHRYSFFLFCPVCQNVCTVFSINFDALSHWIWCMIIKLWSLESPRVILSRSWRQVVYPLSLSPNLFKRRLLYMNLNGETTFGRSKVPKQGSSRPVQTGKRNSLRTKKKEWCFHVMLRSNFAPWHHFRSDASLYPFLGFYRDDHIKMITSMSSCSSPFSCSWTKIGECQWGDVSSCWNTFFFRYDFKRNNY